MQEVKRDNRLSQASVHFVIDRASLFTDHGISGRPIRAKLLIILQPNQVLPFWIDGHPSKEVETLYNCSVFLFRELAIPFHVFSSMSFHVVGPRNRLCVVFFTFPKIHGQEIVRGWYIAMGQYSYCAKAQRLFPSTLLTLEMKGWSECK